MWYIPSPTRSFLWHWLPISRVYCWISLPLINAFDCCLILWVLFGCCCVDVRYLDLVAIGLQLLQRDWHWPGWENCGSSAQTTTHAASIKSAGGRAAMVWWGDTRSLHLAGGEVWSTSDRLFCWCCALYYDMEVAAIKTSREGLLYWRFVRAALSWGFGFAGLGERAGVEKMK